MKKIYYLLFVLVIGLLFVPIAFAKDSVEIIAVELDSKSDNTTINGDPTYSGLTMNFDIAFRAKDDYAKYKVTVKNNTNTDYIISEDTAFSDSSYVTYTYSTDSELKANGETTVYVTITYSKEVDTALLVDSKYTEANKVVVQLKDDNGVIKVPDTAKNMNMALLVFLVLLFLGTLIALIINNENYKKIVGVIVLGLLIIPIHALAAEVIKLTVNVNIEIESGFKVAYKLNNFHKNVEDELVGYDLTDYKCETVYLGAIEEEKKYSYCEGIIVDKVRYQAGETATLAQITILSSFYLGYNFTDECEEQPDGSYLCGEYNPRDLTNGKQWRYSKDTSLENGYLAYDNDKEVMNFEDIIDDWEFDGSLIISPPKEFTMPKHDVLFSIIEMLT